MRLPGIHEDITPGGTDLETLDNQDDIRRIGNTLSNTSPQPISLSPNISQEQTAKLAPCTPRIDISRASSSSQHEDSKDSTPENQAISNLGLGFKEDGALDLRSSTEELDFQDATDQKLINKSRPTSPLVFICDPSFDRTRKDSQTSEICLLSISGMFDILFSGVTKNLEARI